MVLDQDEQHKKNQAEKNEKDKKKMKDLMMFQKVQMGELPPSAFEGSVVSSVNKRQRAKKAQLGGPMQLEEIRMNKGLLKEINQMKKERTKTTTQRGGSPSQMQTGDVHEIQM